MLVFQKKKAKKILVKKKKKERKKEDRRIGTYRVTVQTVAIQVILLLLLKRFPFLHFETNFYLQKIY